MKHKPSKTGFTKLLAADTTLLSADRLLGLLQLETDRGEIELVMNRIVAERLLTAVVEFLQARRGRRRANLCGRAFAIGARRGDHAEAEEALKSRLCSILPYADGVRRLNMSLLGGPA